MKLRLGFALTSVLTVFFGCQRSDSVSNGEDDQQSFPHQPSDTTTHKFCDVIIAGGSDAAIAAAIASADVGAKTCLIEPTDWIGGQLTSSGVTAIDWAWHKVGSLDVAAAARDAKNITPNFLALMAPLTVPNRCFVSRTCYEPRDLLGPLDTLADRYVRAGKLVLVKQAVVKHVVTDGRNVTKIVAVARTPKPGLLAEGYDVLPSQDVPDWYDPKASARFDKTTLEFASGAGRPAVFVDATEWGEVLALSGASYVQGVEGSEGSFDADERCGQSIVYPFVEALHDAPTNEAALPEASDASKATYSIANAKGDTDAAKWDSVWRYRRLHGTAAKASAGDLSQQNWNPGNDYPFGYLLLSRNETAAQRSDWRGGIDFEVLAGAERHAYGWHTFFKAQGGEMSGRVTLDRSVLGTHHGLSKVPYVRDTRRSIGLDDFVLTSEAMLGDAAQVTGKPFRDRVAIGAYAMDIHGLHGCKYPPQVNASHSVLPYFVPFRALTNRDFDNLLVAGKTAAQSFLANAATRLHPVEWATGTAAGASAAYMARRAISSRQALENVEDLQAVVRTRTPVDWTIEGQVHPRPFEPTPL